MKKPLLPGPLGRHATVAASGSSQQRVLRNAGRKLLRQINNSAPGVLHDSDPESLHRLRVAVRRLRVLVALGCDTCDTYDRREARQAASALKWLAQALGPARDSDVFAGEIWPPLRAEIGSERLAAALDAVWALQTARHYRKAQRALAASRFRRLCASLDQLFASPAAGTVAKDGAPTADRYARVVIRRRVERVRRRHHRALKRDTTDDRALHRFRIEIKKLRYELDFLAPLLRRPVAPLLRELARLQGVLGDMNDLAAAQCKVIEALRRRRGVEVARVLHVLASHREAREKSLRRALRHAWKGYRQVQPF